MAGWVWAAEIKKDAYLSEISLLTQQFHMYFLTGSSTSLKRSFFHSCVVDGGSEALK